MMMFVMLVYKNCYYLQLVLVLINNLHNLPHINHHHSSNQNHHLVIMPNDRIMNWEMIQDDRFFIIF